MSKQRPILYSAPMVQAKLKGRKDMTRRAISDKYIINSDPDRYKFIGIDDNGCALFEDMRPEITPWISPIPCPFGKAGDILWGRETLCQEGELGLKYAADNEHIDEDLIPEDHKPYRNYAHCNIPSIHVHKYLSRIYDEVISIRVQRLQDISPDDADREGIESWNEDYTTEEGALHADYANYLWVNRKNHPEYHFPSFPNPIDSFRSLWIKINGKESWELNPWVWVIETKSLSTTGKPEYLP